MIKKTYLHRQYVIEGKSAHEIALSLGCSPNKVHYWLLKHHIPKRSISEAIYIKRNPSGDPFSFKKLQTTQDWFLYGLGLGLYWGEGNKASKTAVRLGNTDPDLIRTFLNFLLKIYQIEQSRLRFGLQLFSDTSQEDALRFWTQKLNVSKKQFQKVVFTQARAPGTYRKKNEYGVLTVYFSNTKLRDTIVSAIDRLHKNKSP